VERQELHQREQNPNNERSHPGKQEKLSAEASQEVCYTTWQLHDLPHIIPVEEEELILLLIMQMMWIG
jgi:hypothetical protein